MGGKASVRSLTGYMRVWLTRFSAACRAGDERKCCRGSPRFAFGVHPTRSMFAFRADNTVNLRRLTHVAYYPKMTYCLKCVYIHTRSSLDKDRLMFIFRDGSSAFFGKTEDERR